jgi:putative transcriptional regulator
MSDEIAEDILAGLREAREFLSGEKDFPKEQVHIPEEIDVARIREKLNMTQSEFSSVFGMSIRTLQGWEQGRRVPTGASRQFLTVLDKEPNAVLRALAAECSNGK